MDANIQTNDWLENELNPKVSYAGQFAILIGLVLGGAIVAALIQLGVLMSITDLKTLMSGDTDKLMALMALPQNNNKVMLMQVLGTLVMMAIPAFLFAKIVSKNSINYLGFNHKINHFQILLVIVIAIVGLFLSGGLGELNKLIPVSNSLKIKFEKLEDDYEKQVMIFSNMKTIGDYVISLIMIAILPAIFEELLFRGALQKLLIDWFKTPHIAIIVTSILFSLVHFSFYGFLPRMMLGMVLGYLFFYGKSIWLNILMHFINNGVAITAMYFAIKNNQSATEAMKDGFPIWVLIIVLPAMVGLLLAYKRICENLSTKKTVYDTINGIGK
ncbi:MAG: CPBP family intramembrane glutamic endopeptidase [Chitinophagaceae bacterium]